MPTRDPSSLQRQPHTYRKPVVKRHHNVRTLFTLTLLAASLAGCGGSSDNDTSGPAATVDVSVQPSLGAIFNADVNLVCTPTGANLGAGGTGSSGVVTVPATADCSGPVLVTVSGKSDNTSTYYDEALGANTPFPAGTSLRAILPSLSGATSVAVTPLTEMAVARALATAGSLAALTTEQAQAANAAVVSQVLGAGVNLDILTPPTLWTSSTGGASLGTSAADTYAYYLAGLASMGSGAASPALAVTAALTADLADGTLDGTASGSFVYSSSSLATQLSTGLKAQAGFATLELQTTVGVASGPVVVSAFTPDHGAVGDTISLHGSGFDTDLFHMSVKFSNNVAADIVSGSATELVVKVPDGAATGPITITNALTGSSQASAADFTVTETPPPPSNVWTSRASPSQFLLNGLSYGNGKFVTVGFGNTILTSADGVSWTASTPPDTDYYEGKAVLWDGARFIMVGDSVYGSSQPALIATSPDGLIWTRRSWSASGTETLTALAVANGRITTVGLNGTLLSSTDGGNTWSAESQSAVQSFEGVAAHATSRVAVGRDGNYNGVILVNTGAGWSAVPNVSNFMPYDVIWAGDRFMAVGGDSANYGASAVVMSSIDGVLWTRTALDASVAPAGYKLDAVLWTGTKLYATGSDGNNKHVIVSSTDLSTWSQEYQGQVSGNGVLAAIATSPSRVVTVGGVKSVTLP